MMMSAVIRTAHIQTKVACNRALGALIAPGVFLRHQGGSTDGTQD